MQVKHSLEIVISIVCKFMPRTSCFKKLFRMLTIVHVPYVLKHMVKSPRNACSEKKCIEWLEVDKA